jgi:hypothetical protein
MDLSSIPVPAFHRHTSQAVRADDSPGGNFEPVQSQIGLQAYSWRGLPWKISLDERVARRFMLL